MSLHMIPVLTERNFQIDLIKMKRGFYKIFAWTYFLRREIKTDIVLIGSCILFKDSKY